MAKHVTNASQMGSANLATVLDTIRRSGKISRAQISDQTGLSAQALTNIIRRLQAEKLIREAGKTQPPLGKPTTLFELNPNSRFAIGVHLDPSFTSVALINLAGEVLHRQRFSTPNARDPQNVIDIIAGAIAGTISIAAVPHEKILGIGIGAPGPVDLTAGVIDNPPHLPGWDRVPLTNELSRVTCLPVTLQKDVVAGALAQRWDASVEQQNGTVIVYVGTGIGVGLISDGQVVRGASGNAGDVAHIVVGESSEEVCTCGRAGCVTTVCSPSALMRRAITAGLIEPGLTTSEGLIQLFTLARQENSEATKLVSDAVIGLARMALVAVDLTDADRLVFEGPFWHIYRPAFHQLARTTLDTSAISRGIHSLEIDDTAPREEIGAIGAATVILDAFTATVPQKSSAQI